MKKPIILLLVCLFVFIGTLPLYGASHNTIVLTVNEVVALVNRSPVLLDVAPFIKEGWTLVPLRFVSEQLGANVDYTTKAGGTVDQVKVGSTLLTVILSPGEQEQVREWKTPPVSSSLVFARNNEAKENRRCPTIVWQYPSVCQDWRCFTNVPRKEAVWK